jgi:hypothetical protein
MRRIGFITLDQQKKRGKRFPVSEKTPSDPQVHGEDHESEGRPSEMDLGDSTTAPLLHHLRAPRCG